MLEKKSYTTKTRNSQPVFPRVGHDWDLGCAGSRSDASSLSFQRPQAVLGQEAGGDGPGAVRPRQQQGNRLDGPLCFSADSRCANSLRSRRTFLTCLANVSVTLTPSRGKPLPSFFFKKSLFNIGIPLITIFMFGDESGNCCSPLWPFGALCCSISAQHKVAQFCCVSPLSPSLLLGNNPSAVRGTQTG